MENKSNYELELMRAKKAIDIVAGSTLRKAKKKELEYRNQ